MNRKKFLFISNIADEKIGSFSFASIKAAQSANFEFHIASNFSASSTEQQRKDEKEYGITIHHIDFDRNPLHPKNWKAYKQLILLIKQERFDIVHCNTPTGGVYGRLAARRCKVRQVIYEAHGFHFYKGAPKFNWFVYYPIERCLAHITDKLITINQEDFKIAHKFHLRNNGKVYYVPGVGIDLKLYKNITINQVNLRKSLSLKDEDMVCISIENLILEQNYEMFIKAIAKIRNKNLKYLICGNISEEQRLKELCKKMNLEKQIHFLGFRSDIKELLQISDIFLSTTLKEGMNSLMLNAMASGLPCIVGNSRENIVLLEYNKGGYVCNDLNEYIDALKRLLEDKLLRQRMSVYNLCKIKELTIGMVNKPIEDIFKNHIVDVEQLIDFMPLWAKKRIEIGVPIDAFIVISVGELNKNKNNQVIISAINNINNDKVHYILCGNGNEKEYLKTQSENYGIKDRVHFLGFRTDINELLKSSDVFVMPSYREGLSRSIMEAMASGLPCIVSDIRGNRDLINNNIGGYLCNPRSDFEFSNAIVDLQRDIQLRKDMIKYNLCKVEGYSKNEVINRLIEIYCENLLR